MRPIALGEVDLRALGRYVTTSATAAPAEVLAPQQVCVGVPGGMHAFIHGMRLLLEQRGDFVVVKIDLRNAFNSISRSAMLRRLARHPRLARLCPLLHALLSCATELRVGAARQPLFPAGGRGDSSEGTQQGMAQSMLAFCVAIQPELEALDRELAVVGGCARGIADDIVAAGPASAVFPAVQRFLDMLREAVGLEAQLAKFQSWAPSYDLEGCPYRLRMGVPVGSIVTADNIGIVCPPQALA